MALKYKNFWISALTAPVATTDITVQIPNGDAANLPALTTGNSIRLVLPVYDGSGNEVDWEIVDVTAVNTATGILTVTRAMEGTTAKVFAIGTKVDLRITADGLNQIGIPITNFAGAPLDNYTDREVAVSVTTATTTLDLATARVFNLAMGINTTLAFSNIPADGVCAVTLICTQDATGGRTLTLPAGTKKPGGTAITLSTAAAAEDWLEIVFLPSKINPRAMPIGKGVA